MTQMVFKRYETKYMITNAQKNLILAAMKPYMMLDQYGRSEICNIYLDTNTYLLARRSIEKPIYKEKLRLRSYGQADKTKDIYFEMKKKYKRIVFKRRIALSEKMAMNWIINGIRPQGSNQIIEEIDYMLKYYQSIHPVAFLSYMREAYIANDNPTLRITFDDSILYRDTNLSLCEPIYGKSILPDEKILMEIKSNGAIPLWLTSVLSQEHIYKTSFSKYGRVYQDEIYSKMWKKKEEL